VIGLTETWLNDNNNDNFKLEEYDYISSNRVNKKGGGVGIYVTKETKYTIRKDLRFFIEDAIESIFIEINMLGSKNIIIGTIYRPPNNKFDIFENAMKYFYTKLIKKTKSVILWEILISIYSNQNPVITPIDLLSNFLHHHIYLFI
jgi:exonuclease III